MDQNMDTPNPTGENQPTQPEPQAPPQPQAPVSEQPESSAPPVVENAEEVSKDAKQWGMFCHLAGLAGYLPLIPYPIGNILGALILWLIKKDEFNFVDDQGKEALNFQITISICLLICIPLCFIVIGLILLPALFIFNIVMIIIASIEANKGNTYRYPFCIRLVK